MPSNKVARFKAIEERLDNLKNDRRIPVLVPWSKFYPGVKDQVIRVSQSFLDTLEKAYGKYSKQAHDEPTNDNTQPPAAQ
jgi:hypothetical protein